MSKLEAQVEENADEPTDEEKALGYIGQMYHCVWSMFACPLNYNIYELAAKFNAISLSKKTSKALSLLTDGEALTIVMVENIRTNHTTVFEYDEDSSIDEENHDMFFQNDRNYYYGDFLVALIACTQHLNQLTFENDEDHLDLIAKYNQAVGVLCVLHRGQITSSDFAKVAPFIEALDKLVAED